MTPIERRHSEGTLEPLGNVGFTWMKGRQLALTPDGKTVVYTAASP